MSIYVIGDIHGALKALQEVLIKANYNPEEDELIFLGDYVDGWTESAELVDFLIKLKENNLPNKVTFIRGNHDNWCEDWLDRGWVPIIWQQNGGQVTLDSYVRTALLVEQSHKDFFHNLIDYHIDDDNNLFIHGGWAYREDEFPVSALYPNNAGTNAKECHWDRSLIAGVKSAHATNTQFNATKPFNKVFIGHTANASFLPEKYCNLWNIDSGGGWSGKLTIMNIDTEEYYQSDFVKNLYPNEKGR